MNDSAIPELSGLRRAALVAAASACSACWPARSLSPAQFFHSYLYGYIYWVGFGIGCLGIVMIYHLTGGGWGVAIRRLLEAGAGTLPFMAVLFVPLLFGLHDIYEWTHTDVMQADEVLRLKMPYLNMPFFIARAAVYFAAWTALRLLPDAVVAANRTGRAIPATRSACGS